MDRRGIPVEDAHSICKDAFKKMLLAQIGQLGEKPAFELAAWSAAIIEILSELQEQQRNR